MPPSYRAAFQHPRRVVAVRGMQLDINYDWSIGYYFTHEAGTVHPHVTRGSQSKGPGTTSRPRAATSSPSTC